MPILDNQRHELFAQEIAKGQTATGAYKAAGYTEDDASAAVQASRLLRKPNVALRITELKTAVTERTVEKTAIDKTWVIDRLVKNIDRSMQAEPVTDSEGTPLGVYSHQPNAANRGLELIGKEIGMFVERKDTYQRPQVVVNVDFSQLDARQLASLANLLSEATPRDDDQKLIQGN